MYGNVNIDTKTGIRYGVISQHSISQAWSDCAEADYGDPTCPECGNEARDVVGARGVSFEDCDQYGGHGRADFACDDCKLTIDSCEAYGDEPIGFHYEGDGYELTDCLDSDVMVIKSPFYTFAPLCSPCVPNAGDLDDAAHFADWLDHDITPLDMFDPCLPRTYCVGHDWFDDGRAPYPVYGRVSKRQCFPDKWYGHYIEADAARKYPHWYGHRAFAMPTTAVRTEYCA